MKNKLFYQGFDTGTDVTIVTQKNWYVDWRSKDVNVQFLGIGTLSHAKQSVTWIEYIGSEG